MENNQLCAITIVFPVDTDDQIISVKKKVFQAVADLPKVKTEMRITDMRDVSDGRGG
ncbi:hypothetical protein ES703_54903 [subsurface metagenome]